MLTSIRSQLLELQLSTSQPLGNTVQAIAKAIAALIIAFRYSWPLTLILLGTMPLNALVLGLISSRMQRHIDHQVDELATAAKYSSTAFSNIETIKCCNGQEDEYHRFLGPIKKAAAFYVRQVRGNALQMGWVKFATFATFMGGFYYASNSVNTGKASTADVMTVFFSCMEISEALQEVLPQMIVLEKGRAAGVVLRRLVSDRTKQASIKNSSLAEETLVPREAPGEITFKNVSFAYPARPQDLVLKDVSCSFAMGETTFVIGRSGSGKSTLAQLLLKLYECSEGQILLDDVAVAGINTVWLRKNITLVEQQSALLDGSLSENVAIGSLEPEKLMLEDVKAATEFALLTKTLNDLPRGLDTLVGPRGSSLSGGQRQRVALARARIRDTPVLILDESTSALDHVSRTLMLSAIRQWRRNKTTIFISHDISQIGKDDYVHLFEHGTLVSSGYRLALEEERDDHFARYLAPAGPDSHRAIIGNVMDPEMSLGEALRTENAPSETMPSNSNARKTRRMTFLPTMFSNNVPAMPGLSAPMARYYGLGTPDTGSTRRQSVLGTSNVALVEVPLPSSLLEQDQRSIISKRKTKRWSDGLKLGLPALTRSEMSIIESSGSDAIQQRRTPEGRRRMSLFRPMEKVSDSEAPSDIIPSDIRDEPLTIHQTAHLSLRDILLTVWPALDTKHRRILCATMICLLAHSASIPLFSWIFSKLIATFYMPYGAAKEALKWSMVTLGLSVADGLATYAFHVGLERCAQVWVDDIRMRAMQRILDQPRQFFLENGNDAQQLASALDRNAEEMRNILGRFVSYLIIAIVMLLIALVWSMIVCWKLTLVAFALTPISWLLVRAFQLVSGRLEEQSNNAGEATASVLSEMLMHMKTVKLYTLEALFRTKYGKAVTEALRIGFKRSIYSAVFFGMSETSTTFLSCLVYYYGGILASNYEFTVPEVILVFSQITFALGSVSGFVAIIPQIASSKDTAMRLLYLANLPQDSHEHQGSLQSTKAGDITFKDVTFSYPSRPLDRTLRNLYLTFPQGSATAIVGDSGSGKSTIASLLLRLYPLTSTTNASDDTAATRGPTIELDKLPIDMLSTPTLRNLIAFVPQTPVLFPATVSENITYGLATESPWNNTYSVRSAARAAGIHEFLSSLPQGYDTLIGEGGLGLSGGQAQRVAIARALVREPQVLLLDECTSALDVESATLVRESIRRVQRVRREVTVIAITHDEEMMRMCGDVVVLKGGRVVERGVFEELKHRNGELGRLLSGGMWVGGE